MLLALGGLAASAVVLVFLIFAELAMLEALPFAVRSHAYGAVVAALIVYSLLHAAIALIGVVFAFVRAAVRGVSAERSLAVRVAALYTFYMAGQGAIAFAVLYWSFG